MSFFPHYSWSTPTARTQHRCDLCGRTIRPGEKYHRMAGMDGLTAWTHRECRHCAFLRGIAHEATGEFEFHDDLIVEWEPTTVAGVRLKALWRKKWQRADGSLYPTPAPNDLADVRARADREARP
jgi:hypothetical protein